MPQAPNIQNNTQYVTDGLEIVSNSDAIHTRDDRGNITLTSGSATNQAVIVENNYDSFTNRSFVNASKTAFNYFKFPPTRFYPSASLPDFTGLLDPAEDIVNQTLTTRYVLPYLGADTPGGEFAATTKKINTLYDSDWYDGISYGGSGGFRRLPLVGPNQAEEGAYIMDPSIIELLRDTNKTLEFDIVLAFVSFKGQGIYIRLSRGTTGDNWRLFQTGGNRYQFESNQFFLYYNNGGNRENQYPLIWFKYRVNLEDLRTQNGNILEHGTGVYDRWYLEACSRNSNGTTTIDGSYIQRNSSAWNIKPIDIPDFDDPNTNITPQDFYGFREIRFQSERCWNVKLNGTSTDFLEEIPPQYGTGFDKEY